MFLVKPKRLNVSILDFAWFLVLMRFGTIQSSRRKMKCHFDVNSIFYVWNSAFFVHFQICNLNLECVLKRVKIGLATGAQCPRWRRRCVPHAAMLDVIAGQQALKRREG